MDRRNPMIERRKHPRYPVDVDAKLVVGENQELDCRIRDICEGGALVSCANSGVNLDSETPCNLIFDLQDHTRAKCRFEARTVRLEKQAMGLRFVRSSMKDMGRLKKFLQELAHPRQQRRPEGPLRVNPENARRILQKVSLHRLPGLIEVLQEALLNGLLENSEKAASDRERFELTGDAGLLSGAIRSGRFQELLRCKLMDPLSRLHAKPAPQQPETGEQTGLELVDPDKFDVWLAASAMLNRLSQDLREPLDKLRTQTTKVYGEDIELPIDPQGIAQGLEESLSQVGLRPASQCLCLNIAGKQLGQRLGDLYTELIGAWENAGLSAIPSAPAVRPRRAAATRPAAGPGHGGHGQAEATDDDVSAEFSDLLLDERIGDAPGMGSTAPPLRQRVERILERVQEQHPEAKSTPRMHERIEVTDRMLSNMLSDPMVPSGIKQLIDRLSMGFLALAVREPAFYHDTSHPMVRLIDQLEHLSMLAPDDADLKRLAQQAVRADVRDREGLSAIAEQVDGLAQRLSGNYQRNVERLVATYEGNERLLEAREEIRGRLNRNFAGRTLHRSVNQLIEQAWRALLELVHLRKGANSTVWKAYWQTLMTLYRLTEGGKPDNPEWENMGATLERVQEGLSYIGFDPFHRGRLLEDLSQALGSARAGTLSPRDRVVFREIPPIRRDDQAEGPPEGVSAKEWEYALAQVDHMAVGSTLRYHRERQKPPHHLVWRNDRGDELVFVDPQTLSPETLERRQLAQDIQQGRLSIQAPSEMSATERATSATLAEMQSRINYHETHDSLTGLSNRQHLNGTLTDLLIQGSEHFVDFVLGFVDIDHFDTLTSSFGYQAGERMLVAVAKALEIALEQALCIAYMGGSRYAYIHNVEDRADALGHGELVRKAITELPFYWNGKPYPVEASLGLLVVTVECDNPETLLSSADAACTTAKRAGGNQVMLFDEDNEIIAQQKHAIQGWLRAEDVIRSQRIRLRCQRIAHTDPGNDASHHYEILLSVYDEQGAPTSLLEFISAAEAFNLMAEMDRHILEKAMRWVHEQPSVAERLGGIAINLSGQSMSDSGLVERVRNHLRELALEPSLISFEVTETAAIANLDQAVAIIRGIRDLGCRFALDDFGTGMSSYSYLKRMPVDYLKIDGSFITDILENPQDAAIVKSINEIAHFMGKETIAEYVESPEIRERLGDIGVDYVQGYAIEKPRYLDEIRD